jgi:solute carrier family 50 protein (sugar transporter)
MIVANFMFAAPLKSVRHSITIGTLGTLNPTPWAFMTGNCIGWVTYSFLINNLFVFFANAPGLLLSVWLNMAAAKLQYCDRISGNMRSSFVALLDSHRRSFRIPGGGGIDLGGEDEEDDDEDDDVGQDNNSNNSNREEGEEQGTTTSQQQQRKQQQRPKLDNNDIHTFATLRKMALDITIQKTSIPAPHEKVVVGIVAFWIGVISILYFLQLTIDQWKLIIGFIVNINLLFFYGAPLSTIYVVLTTRDSSSIHRPTMLLNTTNAVFWTAFGIGTLDWFIIVPNGLGAILGFVQMILRMIVPVASVEEEGEEEAESSLPKGELELGVGTDMTTETMP